MFPPSPTATNRLPVQTTELRSSYNPIVLRAVHSAAFREVRVVPFHPTAIISPPAHATDFKTAFVGECRFVHSTPSDDVRMTPGRPTAINCLPVHVMPYKVTPAASCWYVQFSPSGEDRIMAEKDDERLPIARNRLPVHIIWQRSQGIPTSAYRLVVVDQVCKRSLSQLEPSRETITLPCVPTETNLVPVHTTPLKLVQSQRCNLVHSTPSGEVNTMPRVWEGPNDIIPGSSAISTPTATSSFPVHTTERICPFATDARLVQVSPSGDVYMAVPTATRWLPVQMTDRKSTRCKTPSLGRLFSVHSE